MFAIRKWFRRVEVAEISISLPFVQVSLKPVEDPGPEPASGPILRQSPSPTAVASAHSAPAPSTQPQRVELLVTERTVPSGRPAADEIFATRLTYLVCQEIREDGLPVFRFRWRPFAGAIDLYPGDILWLRLSCYNRAGRVLHNVPIQVRDLPLIERLPGVVTCGGQVHTWLRSLSKGLTVPHYNPSDKYTMHCLCRTPLSLLPGRPTALQPLERQAVADILHEHRELYQGA